MNKFDKLKNFNNTDSGMNVEVQKQLANLLVSSVNTHKELKSNNTSKSLPSSFTPENNIVEKKTILSASKSVAMADNTLNGIHAKLKPITSDTATTTKEIKPPTPSKPPTPPKPPKPVVPSITVTNTCNRTNSVNDSVDSPRAASSIKKIHSEYITVNNTATTDNKTQAKRSASSSSNDDLDDDDDGAFEEINTLNDGYLEPQTTPCDAYLEPVNANIKTINFKNTLRVIPLIDDDGDLSVRRAIEKNRYFDINYKWDPNVKDTCFQLLKSFMATEAQYITILKILNIEYFDTIKKCYSMNGLNELVLQDIFKYVKEIFEIHEMKFSKELEERVQDWQKKPFIYDIVTKYANDLKIYDEYINHFEGSFECLIDCFNKSPEFSEYLKRRYMTIKNDYKNSSLSQTKNDFNDSIDLKSCFIHILKWPDCFSYFLNAYLKGLRENSNEISSLRESLEYFNELSKKATEIIGDSLRIKALINLQKRIGSKYNIMNKKRTILKEGALTHAKKHFGSTEKYYVVLLNDTLIMGENLNDGNNFKLKYLLDVIGLQVYDDINTLNKSKTPFKLTNGLRADNAFMIYVPSIKKKFRFVARNMQEKEKWLNEFEIVANANKYQEEINRANIGKVVPKWIPDNLCQYCCKCKTEFTTINRRHHCRACGYIFCGRCSRAQVNLEYDENKKNRICDICYDYLFNTFRSRPPNKDEIDGR